MRVGNPPMQNGPPHQRQAVISIFSQMPVTTDTSSRGTFLNSVHDALIRNNIIKCADSKQRVVVQRAERVERGQE